MLIDDNFTELVESNSVSDSLYRILCESYSDYCREIMSELTYYTYQPYKNSFGNLDIFSEEYELQKYFEPRIEACIRQFLFADIFERMIEQKGYKVVDLGKKYIEDLEFLTNKEFEEQEGFEFIVISGDDRIGCRLTDISPKEAKKYYSTGEISKIIIVDWYNRDGIYEEEKIERTNGIDKVEIIGLREFTGQWLEENDAYIYEMYWQRAIQFFKETIGICSIPKLTAPTLLKHRIDVERVVLKKTIENIKMFAEIEKKGKGEQKKDTHFGYGIIDYDNLILQNKETLESRSKDLLLDSGVLEYYENNKLYKALIGQSDFAKSFLTSEYLYDQFDQNDCFDYTSIVSGYLKSIEQLLRVIVCREVGKDYKIKNRSKITNKEGKKPFKIYLTRKNIQYADLSIGTLISFLKEYSLFDVDDSYIDTIIDCLNCYRIECRNCAFHHHNNYDWDRVRKIRANTLILYVIILGGCKHYDEDLNQNIFNIIQDDRLERIYYWLRRNKMYRFLICFSEDEGYRLVERLPEVIFPLVDGNGKLSDDFEIKIKYIDGKDVDRDGMDHISINHIPKDIICTTTCGNYSIDFSM